MNPYTVACEAYQEQLKKLQKTGDKAKIKSFLAERTTWIANKQHMIQLADKRDAAVRILTTPRNIISVHHVEQ